MAIVVLSPLGPTGNSSTAERIRRCLLSGGFQCHLESVSSFKAACELNEYITKHNIECVLAIHLWRSGVLLQGCRVPTAVILGGTDVNEHYKDGVKLKVMTKIVKQARFVIGFNQAMITQALSLWPHCKEKIICQPQGVCCMNPSSFSLEQNFKIDVSEQDKQNHNFLQTESMVIFLLVAGIRPVKDPLFLASAISAWHKDDCRIHLVIVGPELDELFSKEVKQEVKKYPGVILYPALSKDDLHGAIKNSFALVNSSVSEGMSGAVIEAMYLGVPVLVRNNPGNASLVQQYYNGLLFDTPQEFISRAKELISSEDLQETLTRNAQKYVQTVHSSEEESLTYCSVVSTLLGVPCSNNDAYNSKQTIKQPVCS